MSQQYIERDMAWTDADRSRVEQPYQMSLQVVYGEQLQKHEWTDTRSMLTGLKAPFNVAGLLGVMPNSMVKEMTSHHKSQMECAYATWTDAL